MKKKILCITSLILVLIMLLAACKEKEPEHTHSYGDWKTQTEPTCSTDGTAIQECECGHHNTKLLLRNDKHSFSNGKCTACNLSAVKVIGDIVQKDPDQYTSGSYIKSFLCSNFSSKEGASKYGLGFAYNSATETLIIQLTKSDFSVETISVTINNGVVASNYEYLYSYNNPAGSYTDKIQGTFNATTLSSTSSFSYTNYSAGSGAAFKYFVDDYKEDAATSAKLLAEYLDEFLTHHAAGFNSETLNFK